IRTSRERQSDDYLVPTHRPISPRWWMEALRAPQERCAMPQFKKLTPNLIVASVERSLAFYTGILGFERGLTVPEASPFVFASVTSGPVEIFFNDVSTVAKESPQFAGKPFGGG